MNGFTGLARGLRYSFNLSGYRTDAVVLHEIAHHFTLDYRVPDVPEAVGVGWLYFNHRVKGHCDVGEIYADLLTYYTRNKPSPGLGYLYGCNRIAKNGVPDKESKEVAGSVARGEIANWFQEKYARADETTKLDALWSDIRAAVGNRRIAYLMRDMYGGYCSHHEANWAVDSGPSHGNPWRDGGCHWRKPQDLAVVVQYGSLRVTWSEPEYPSSPAATHYVVQWRAADQEYGASQQAVVPATATGYQQIPGLTNGVDYFVRVAAVYSGSQTVFVDNDGLSRVVEDSATPGKPNKPENVSVSAGDHSISLSWEEPRNTGIGMSGFVVEWKSGTEDYDPSRRLEVPGGEVRRTTVSGLTNGVTYTIKVSAKGLSGVVGKPSQEKRASPFGPPEAPSGVTAVGGKESLLYWEPPADGTIYDGLVVQWRTGGSYRSGDEVVVWGPGGGRTSWGTWLAMGATTCACWPTTSWAAASPLRSFS